ncbi:uncharacterized protein BT62DRAFT_1071183, partial [Guyanagaster necrorhizus]
MTEPPLSPAYAPPGESNNNIWVEQANLNGMALTLVAYDTSPFQTSSDAYNTQTKEKRWWMWIYMTYINDRHYTGGPNAFTFSFYAATSNLMSFIVYTILGWLADGLILYHFFIIYDRNLWTAIVLAVIYLRDIGSALGSMISVARSPDSFGATTSNLLLPPLGQMEGIAPLLIILKVINGRARNSTTGAPSRYKAKPLYERTETEDREIALKVFPSSRGSTPTSLATENSGQETGRLTPLHDNVFDALQVDIASEERIVLHRFDQRSVDKKIAHRHQTTCTIIKLVAIVFS